MVKSYWWVVVAVGCACGRPMSSEMPVDASVGTPADGGRDAGPCWPPAMPRTRRAAGIDPPAGWSQVLSAPDGGPASRSFGVSVASAPDENGQPLIAAFRIDPNGDGHELDDDLVFTRWNGSSGSFEPLVTLEVPNRPDYALSRLVGEAHSIAVAQDVTTGRIGVAFASTNGLFLYVSDDEGRTFQLSRTRLNDATRPVLALRAGGLWLGYVAGPGDLHLEQGCGDSTLATSVYAPYALGFDAVGQPGLALIQQVPTDSYFDVGFLRPGSSVTPLYQGFGALLGSSGSSAAVAFAGTEPIVVTHQLLNGLKYPTEVPLIVSRLHESAGRTTTAQLQKLTVDGGTERTS